MESTGRGIVCRGQLHDDETTDQSGVGTWFPKPRSLSTGPSVLLRRGGGQLAALGVIPVLDLGVSHHLVVPSKFLVLNVKFDAVIFIF